MKVKKDYKSETLDIVKTEDWDRARGSNNRNLRQYIRRHRDTDKNCMIVWNHVETKIRDYESEVSEIIETKDWDRSRTFNDKILYNYVRCHRNTDEGCGTIWEHIRPRDYKSEILDIIKTKDWNKARKCNDGNLYRHIRCHKDTDENCRLIWKHMIKNHCSYTIKDYLLYYFKHGKPKCDDSLRVWFFRKINKSDQCCIDIKNLIIAADTYKDPIAIETLELIKNHLEKEGI